MELTNANRVFEENGLCWTKHAKRAVELFKSGYNCAQSVFGAFSGDVNIPFETAMALSSGFGGGMGRLREVCGAVTGSMMVLGLLFGPPDVPSDEVKAAGYLRVQRFAKAFETAFGSYLCRDLLGLDLKNDSPIPEKRTPEYYSSRPCALYFAFGAALLDRVIAGEKQIDRQEVE